MTSGTVISPLVVKHSTEVRGTPAGLPCKRFGIAPGSLKLPLPMPQKTRQKHEKTARQTNPSGDCSSAGRGHLVAAGFLLSRLRSATAGQAGSTDIR